MNTATSFNAMRSSLKIQYNVIKALVLREIITRWGRKNIGFAWLFLEPMLIIGFFAAIFGLRGRFESVVYHVYGIPVLAFILIGYAPFMLWRNTVKSCTGAMTANKALLHHRNLRALDFYASRMLLDIVSVTTSFSLLLVFLVATKLAHAPVEATVFVAAWCLLIWFAIGFGLTFGPLLAKYKLLNTIWRAISLLLVVASGVFFFAAWLPPALRNILLYVPMLHLSEMIKHGYFGEIIKTYESVTYIMAWNMVLSFTGLYIAYGYGKKIK